MSSKSYLWSLLKTKAKKWKKSVSLQVWCSVIHSVMSNSLWPHGLPHARLPCPSPSPWVCRNSYPLSQSCHPTILSSVVPFSSHLQSFLTSESFLMSQLFPSRGQSTEASASVLPINIQDWFPLRLTHLISLQPKVLSRVFSNTIFQKHQFFSAQPSSFFFFFSGNIFLFISFPFSFFFIYFY